MRVAALQATGFRNLAPLVLEPGPRFNVLSGDNGQGKTNLLEALYLLGTLRPFRASTLGEVVTWGGSEAHLGTRILHQGLERTFELAIAAGRRAARLDGKPPRRLTDWFRDVNVVLFAPDDLRVPRGSPQGRRRFLDRSVFNRDVVFLSDAQRYARVLRSRAAVLRDGGPEDLLDVYDDQVAAAGARVVTARRRTLTELAPRLATAYQAITRSGLHATATYQTHPELLETSDEESARVVLLALVRAGRRRDLYRKQTGVGPHVDDILFALDGQPARAFASQGQLRALVLAWKTAEMDLLSAIHPSPPVLLLDDVSSELDAQRNELLFSHLAALACQCFVTTTHPKHVLVQENRLDFQVVAGHVRPRA